MKSFLDRLRADQRLVILRLLAHQPDYRLNISVLQDGLDLVGHRVSRAEAMALAEWLRDAGLVSIDDVGDVKVVEITSRGIEVAEGHTIADGVKRPRPGE